MKRTILSLMLAVAAIWAAGCGTDEDPKLAVGLDGAAAAVAPGDTVVVSVTVENALGVRAASFFVDFDADLLDLVDARCDAGFWGGSGLAVHEPTDTGASVGVGRLGGTAGDGPENGTLARLLFRCVSDGLAEVACAGFRLVDGSGRPCDGSGSLETVRVQILIETPVD